MSSAIPHNADQMSSAKLLELARQDLGYDSPSLGATAVYRRCRCLRGRDQLGLTCLGCAGTGQVRASQLGDWLPSLPSPSEIMSTMEGAYKRGLEIVSETVRMPIHLAREEMAASIQTMQTAVSQAVKTGADTAAYVGDTLIERMKKGLIALGEGTGGAVEAALGVPGIVPFGMYFVGALVGFAGLVYLLSSPSSAVTAGIGALSPSGAVNGLAGALAGAGAGAGAASMAGGAGTVGRAAMALGGEELGAPQSRPILISSPYGWRIHPVQGTRKFHDGIDIPLPVGTPIRACAPGRVIRIDRADSPRGKINGNAVHIEGQDGYRWAYLHLALPQCLVGQQVANGQQIALSGNTGRSTGPHLHLQVYAPDGQTVDPTLLFPRGTFRRA